MQIGGQAAQPRVLLASVPYALKAGDAATLGGLPASAFALVGARPSGTVSGGDAALFSGQAVTSNTVTTSGGTSGTIPVFTGASTIGNSMLVQNANGIGIGDSPNARLDVNGKAIFRGIFNLSRAANATTTAGASSYPFSLNAQTWSSKLGAAVGPVFEFVAEPTGNNTTAPGAKLSLLYNNGTAAAAEETGLYFNPDGTIHFASGQTFPGGPSGGGVVNASSYDLGGTLFAYGNASNAFLGFAGNGKQSTGSGNLGVGNASLSSLTSGSSNSALGNATLVNTTTGNSNTAIGDLALEFNTVGGNNTAVGGAALIYNTNGNFNTAIGEAAGPDSLSENLTRATAIGANATVSQSNSLVLGQTTAGSPGASHVNVGIGTAKPRSILEASASASGALGPALTLTNTAGGLNAAASIDFNTYYHASVAYTNPTARIEAVDDDNYGNSIQFLTKADGADGNGLQPASLIVGANGGVTVTAFTAPSGVGQEGGIFIGGECICSNADIAPGDGVYAVPGGSRTTLAVGFAGYFEGNIAVAGSVTSDDATHVRIDDPVDPANKYLVQSSVQSSENMNIYTGNVTTDEFGLATVTLPKWFEAANGDFRYQLTVIGGRFAQAIVSKEIANNQFTISTNASNVKVSWQVTAVRQDAYAQAHPLVAEQVKPASERGYYVHPEIYGQPAEKQTEWGRNPRRMEQVKEIRARQRLQANSLEPGKRTGAN